MLGVVEDRRRVGVAHERGVDDALGSRRLPRKEHFLPNGDVHTPWKFSVVICSAESCTGLQSQLRLVFVTGLVGMAGYPPQ